MMRARSFQNIAPGRMTKPSGCVSTAVSKPMSISPGVAISMRRSCTASKAAAASVERSAGRPEVGSQNTATRSIFGCRALSRTADDPELVDQMRIWAVDFADEADEAERRAVERERVGQGRPWRRGWRVGRLIKKTGTG